VDEHGFGVLSATPELPQLLNSFNLRKLRKNEIVYQKMPYAMFPLPYRGGESIAKGQIEYKYLLISFLFLIFEALIPEPSSPRRVREGLGVYEKVVLFYLQNTKNVCFVKKGTYLFCRESKNYYF